MEFYKILARLTPNLRLKLLQARLPDTPEEYMRKTLVVSGMIAGVFMFLLFAFTSSFLVGFVTFFVVFPICFFYLKGYVDARIAGLNKKINKEIVFAGRFLIIELESGVPIYQTFENMGKNYETIGIYFQEILERMDLGTSIEESLDEVITVTPSPEFRKMLWQLVNSIRTGSEVTGALRSVFDQIVREQQIAVKEYGRKLNPMAMFYMMIAVIVPSLGTIMIVVLTSFLGIQLMILHYAVIAMLVGFVQFMFLAIIKSSRPPVDF